MAKLKALITKIYEIFFRYLKGGVAYARYCGVSVGSDCRIYTSSFGSEPFLITIGDRVTITSGVKLLTHDGSTWLVRNSDGRRYQRYAPVIIGSDVFVGVNAIVMPGITIGSRVVVGAGAVVTKNIPDNSVAVGNPARVIAAYDSLDQRIRERCVNDSELDGISDYRLRVFRAIELSREKNEGK